MTETPPAYGTRLAVPLDGYPATQLVSLGPVDAPLDEWPRARGREFVVANYENDVLTVWTRKVRDATTD